MNASWFSWNGSYNGGGRTSGYGDPTLADGPERSALYAKMNRIAAAYAPLRPIVHRVGTSLWHPWLYGYQRHPVMRQFWKFVDIDPAAQAQARK